MNAASPASDSLRCVLVLGQSGALGTAVSRAFSDRGWQVLGTVRRNRPSSPSSLQVDVTQTSDLDRLQTWLKEKTPRLDAVVHCIGNTRDQLIARMSDAEWNECLDVNLTSAFRIARLLLPWFTRQKEGHFVFISSWAGRVGRVGQANYAAAKAGLIALTQSLAREYASRNIRANCIVPGVFESPMTAALSKEALARTLADSATGELTDVRELAAFIVNLAETKDTTGQVFQLDGRIGPVG
jgi:3-oxoacyl-[acyl-carrier protein] reductase